MRRLSLISAVLALCCSAAIPAFAQGDGAAQQYEREHPTQPQYQPQYQPHNQPHSDEGWRNCAFEGQTCNVNGRATVRFGTDGRWASRSVSNYVQCDNDAFGDPAPGQSKRCQVRVSGNYGSGNYGGGSYGSGSAQGWSFCAAEGEICRFQGRADVRFGQGNSFVTRTAYGSVRCDVADFGDPTPGATKFCEVRRSGGQSYENSTQASWAGWGSGASNSGWRFCAAEGGTCRVKGNGVVRFGDGRNFKTQNVNGEIPCNAGVFGDPARGVTKHCEVQAIKYNDGGSSSGWSQCAREGERCNFGGYAQLRYGAAGRYVYRDGTNGVTCASNSFGNDPYPGKAKVCEIKR
jgi:hypothetical protein